MNGQTLKRFAGDGFGFTVSNRSIYGDFDFNPFDEGTERTYTGESLEGYLRGEAYPWHNLDLPVPLFQCERGSNEGGHYLNFPARELKRTVGGVLERLMVLSGSGMICMDFISYESIIGLSRYPIILSIPKKIYTFLRNHDETKTPCKPKGNGDGKLAMACSSKFWASKMSKKDCWFCSFNTTDKTTPSSSVLAWGLATKTGSPGKQCCFFQIF